MSLPLLDNSLALSSLSHLPMLANLLRLSYLAQLLLGVWLGVLWRPTDQVLISGALGAVFTVLGLQALLTFSSMVLSWPSTAAPQRRWTAVTLFLKVWLQEWRAAVKVFVLRQPWSFRHAGIGHPEPAAPDAALAVPVLLVHGYICNHRVWDDLTPELRRRGHTVLAVDLEPLFSGIDTHVATIEAAVQKLIAGTGQARVALVGHSMGGLVIRAWMRAYGTAQVERVITLATPHQGSLLAAAALTSNGGQMRWQSRWLRELADSEAAPTRSLIHIALTDTDNIVYPQLQQTLEGCQVTQFSGLGHLEMCVSPKVIGWLCQQLAPASNASVSVDLGKVSATGGATEHSASQAKPNRPSDLFWAFSWIALQGFGGVLAVLQRELVDKRNWMTQRQFVEDWSVSQILPGPNVVNLALMMGDRYFGWRGSLAALTGIVIFPMLLVIALAVTFSGVSDVPEVKGALRGMGAVAAGMIAGQGFRLMAALRGNVLGKALALATTAATFVASALLGMPLVWILITVGGTACIGAYIRLKKLPNDWQP